VLVDSSFTGEKEGDGEREGDSEEMDGDEAIDMGVKFLSLIGSSERGGFSCCWALRMLRDSIAGEAGRWRNGEGGMKEVHECSFPGVFKTNGEF